MTSRSGKKTAFIRACGAAAVALAVAACAGDPQPVATGARYPLTGEIVELRPNDGTLIIAHDAVEGYMSAMTMPFNVGDETWVYDHAQPGARVRATLVVDGTRSYLEDVSVLEPASAGTAAAAVVENPDPGDEVPVIDLLIQDGTTVSLADYHGLYYAFTYIYTRCPLPDFCPKMTEGFLGVFNEVEADPDRYGDLHLLTISIDPEHDTPMRMREYAARYLDDTDAAFERWSFATAVEPTALRDLGQFSGLRFAPDRSEFVHSLRTLLVDPEGRLIKAYVGNFWTAEELLTDLEAAVHGASEPGDAGESTGGGDSSAAGD